MSEAEDRWVDLSEVPSIADERWLYTTNAAQPGDPNSWDPINLAHLEEQPPTEPTLGGLGIVYPGKRHVFSGPQESAKTLAAYVIGIEVVRAGGRLVLIDFEMGRWDARTRLRELGVTSEELSMISYVEPAEPATPAVITNLVRLAPSLVLIDAAAGAYDLQGLDDNKRSDVERFTGLYVRGFWQAGIASIVLDHVVKNVEGRGKYAIGSERKVGGADVHLGFEAITSIKRGGHGLYKITTHKDRGGFLKRGRLADFELESDPVTNEISWKLEYAKMEEGDTFRPTHLMEKVSVLLELQSEPISRKKVGDAKLGKDEYVRVALDVLAKEGYVLELRGSRGARLASSRKPYREAEDPKISASTDLSPPQPDLSSAEVKSPQPTSAPPLQGDEAEGRGRPDEISPPPQPEFSYDDIPF